MMTYLIYIAVALLVIGLLYAVLDVLSASLSAGIIVILLVVVIAFDASYHGSRGETPAIPSDLSAPALEGAESVRNSSPSDSWLGRLNSVVAPMIKAGQEALSEATQAIRAELSKRSR